MNVQQIRYAAAVAKCGSTAAAARKLLIAQPNLSRGIQELEQELGFALFSRSVRGMAVTPQGKVFLRRAQEVLTGLDRLQEEFSAGKSIPVPEKIALPDIARAAEYLPADAGHKIVQKTVSSEEVLTEVQDGTLTFAVIQCPAEKPPAMPDNLSAEITADYTLTLYRRGKCSVADILLIPASYADDAEVLPDFSRRIVSSNRSALYTLFLQEKNAVLLSDPLPAALQDVLGAEIMPPSTILPKYREYRITKK